MVALALIPAPDPKRGLEAPERRAGWANLGILPVAYARDTACFRVYVNVVEEVSMVGHSWPVVGEEVWELNDEVVQSRAKANGQPL